MRINIDCRGSVSVLTYTYSQSGSFYMFSYLNRSKFSFYFEINLHVFIIMCTASGIRRLKSQRAVYRILISHVFAYAFFPIYFFPRTVLQLNECTIFTLVQFAKSNVFWEKEKKNYPFIEYVSVLCLRVSRSKRHNVSIALNHALVCRFWHCECVIGYLLIKITSPDKRIIKIYEQTEMAGKYEEKRLSNRGLQRDKFCIRNNVNHICMYS